MRNCVQTPLRAENQREFLFSVVDSTHKIECCLFFRLEIIGFYFIYSVLFSFGCFHLIKFENEFLIKERQILKEKAFDFSINTCRGTAKKRISVYVISRCELLYMFVNIFVFAFANELIHEKRKVLKRETFASNIREKLLKK